MRSTNKAPDFLSNSYFTGSPPTGTSITTLIFSGGLSPVGMRSMFIGSLLGQVAAAPKQREPEEQCRDAGGHGTNCIACGEAIGVAFDQQCRVERESREGREAAEDPGGEEQPHVLGDARTKHEI